MSAFTTELLESSKKAIEAYLSEAPGVSDSDRYDRYPGEDIDIVAFPNPNIQWAAAACDLYYTLEKHIFRLTREAKSSGDPGYETEMWLSLSDRERTREIIRLMTGLQRPKWYVAPKTESHLVYRALHLAQKMGVAESMTSGTA